MDNEDNETVPLASTSTRTVTHVPSVGDSDYSSSSINLKDPDKANTKGRPGMLTIKEAIKQNKFYNCSHCRSNLHTKKNCTNLDKVYDLPKRKRSRPQNSRNIKKSEYCCITLFVILFVSLLKFEHWTGDGESNKRTKRGKKKNTSEAGKEEAMREKKGTIGEVMREKKSTSQVRIATI